MRGMHGLIAFSIPDSHSTAVVKVLKVWQVLGRLLCQPLTDDMTGFLGAMLFKQVFNLR